MDPECPQAPQDRYALPASEFDEEKCRKVLVKNCAHVPRNYQYRDGIQLIFLILRDYLGDEHLGRACGVLYELIEIDCQHTDDKGAAFQRWKYHHMKRYSDLELPHVPHLTTVTTAIVPTARLIEWRGKNPERYITRLSDHAAISAAPNQGCVRSRRRWMIDHTMYISSRNNGTQIYRCMNAKEFHEKQWTTDEEPRGRLVEQRSIDLTPASLGGEPLSSIPPDSPSEHAERPQSSKPSRPEEILQMVRKISIRGKSQMTTPDRTTTSSTIGPSLTIEPMRGKSGNTAATEQYGLPVESERRIPNAAFARKFRIYEDTTAIPPYIRESPIAGAKVALNPETDRVSQLCHSKIRKGLLTPQLWYDNGIDYRWSKR